MGFYYRGGYIISGVSYRGVYDSGVYYRGVIIRMSTTEMSIIGDVYCRGYLFRDCLLFWVSI